MICDYKPLKSDPHRVRLTVGGDKLEYLDDAAFPAASLLKTKLLLNNTISGAHNGACVLAFDIKYLFLHIYMERCKYIRNNSNYFTPIYETSITSTTLLQMTDMFIAE